MSVCEWDRKRSGHKVKPLPPVTMGLSCACRLFVGSGRVAVLRGAKELAVHSGVNLRKDYVAKVMRCGPAVWWHVMLTHYPPGASVYGAPPPHGTPFTYLLSHAPPT
jgi:hypothetical protein